MHATSMYLLSAQLVAFVMLAAGQGVHFDCPSLPPLTKPAKTVYELRPQDIKVVMALGDSITAGVYPPGVRSSIPPDCVTSSLSFASGFGMMGAQGNLFDDLQEYRVRGVCGEDLPAGATHPLTRR